MSSIRTRAQRAGDVGADPPELAGGSSKSEYAYGRIREAIVTGRYGPGYRLVFSVLARDLGVSVQPVREATRRLEAEGWVHHERNVGAQVAAYDPSRWIEGMQVLAVLDGYATARAAPNMRAATLDRASAINAEMGAAVTRMDAFAAMKLNRTFHETLLECCDNQMLADAVRSTWDRLDNMHRSHSFYGGIAQESVGEHRELLALLEKNADADRVERFCRNHLLRVLNAYLASSDYTAREAQEPVG